MDVIAGVHGEVLLDVTVYMEAASGPGFFFCDLEVLHSVDAELDYLLMLIGPADEVVVVVRVDHVIWTVHICFAVVTESAGLAGSVLIILEGYLPAVVDGAVDLIYEIEGPYIGCLGGSCKIEMAGELFCLVLAFEALEFIDEFDGACVRNEVRSGDSIDEELDLFRLEFAVAEIVIVGGAYDCADVVAFLTEGGDIVR